MKYNHKKHEWTEERSERFIKSVENKVEKRYKPIVKKISSIIEKFSIGEINIILDVGCGPGYLLFELQKSFPKVKIIGIDSSDLMINTAIKNANEKNRQNFEFKKGYAEHVPVEDNTIDLTTCFNSLHDFKDMKQTLKENYRILRKNGIFILQDRSGTYPKWKFISVIYRMGLKNAWRYFKTRHSIIDPKIVQSMMHEIGFQILFSEKKEHYIFAGKK